jgi:hypothetical protein
MESELDEPPFVHLAQGDRSAASVRVTVSHDLGDRTIVVMLLLGLVIAVCAWRIALDQAQTEFNGRMQQAQAEMAGQYLRDVAAKLQVNTNHTDLVSKDLAILKETQDANRKR